MTGASPFARLETAVAEARGLLESPAAHALLSHWAELAATGYPTRKDLNPLGFVAALPNVWLRSYEPRTRRFLCDLAGDAVRESHDQPLVGSYLEDILKPAEIPLVRAAFERTLLRANILISVGRLFREIRRPGLGERLVLPLYTPDGAPAGLVGCAVRLDERPELQTIDGISDRLLTYIPLREGETESSLT